MISVVIPMYNSENTIIRALDSIKNQTELNKIAEIIIINDGSTDNSLEIVKKYKIENMHMNIIIINRINGGVSSARNEGLKVAKSEWIALLDSDDEWLPDKTKIQLKAINDNPRIDFIGGNATNKDMYIIWKKIDSIYKANIIDLCLKCFPPTPTALFKRTIVDKIGFFDESQIYGEDMNYFNKICIFFNYYHLPIQLVILDGGNKKPFGDRGLSANLKGMHEGNIKNITELKDGNIISCKFYYFLKVFYYIKYFRRIIISKFRF